MLSLFILKASKFLGIQVVFRQNEDRRLYGVTFVDHRSKSVFNGSDLGKPYSAVMLADRLKNMENNDKEQPQKIISIPPNSQQRTDNFLSNLTDQNDGGSLLDILFKEEQQDMVALGRLQQNKRKKKRKGHSL